MSKLLTLVLVLSAHVAFAQELPQYNRGLTAFNAGDFDRAALIFYELSEAAKDADVRAKSEYYLAQSLLRKQLPFSAFIYYQTIVDAGEKHPFYLRAVEGLINVQQILDDNEVIPRLVNKHFNEAWATLPPEVLSRINYLIGSISYRQLKFQEARSFLEAVPRQSPIYSKAQYLLGLTLADQRYPGGAQREAALRAFQQVVSLPDPQQVDRVQTQQLAMLGIGRVLYEAGDYKQSSEWYERVPRFSRFWNVALFENSFARFQNDDFGGALGSLQSLHAPQFAGAFEPESWILKATVYYFSCLYDEADAALAQFDAIYLPMLEKLKALTAGDRPLPEYFRLVQSDGNAIPRPVHNWILRNERMSESIRLIEQVDRERQAVSKNAGWNGSKLPGALVGFLGENREVLVQKAGQLAKGFLVDALRQIQSFSGNAEIIRFETSKGEKDLVESGVDQERLLAQQRLFRPRIPAENWNYWQFQGEFWIDEIGYYQYTLKRGCPAANGE